MTKHEIIEQVSKDNTYLDYCKKVCNGKDIHKDLYQYVILTMLEMNEETLIDVFNRGKIKAYVLGIIYKSIYGNRSSFFTEYEGKIKTEEINNISHFELSESEIEFDSKLNEFDIELQKECNRCIVNGIYPAQVKIYEIYEEVGSYTKVAELTQIPFKTVQRYVKGTREKILKNLNDKNSSSNPTD